MGQSGSITIDPNKFVAWDLTKASCLGMNYFRSEVFNQEGENFAAFVNKQTSTIIVFCCSAEQWHYDEMFSFQVFIAEDFLGTILASTTASFSKKYPFCLITVNKELPDKLYFRVILSSKYPYTRKDRYLGIRNSGSTCYMASVLQILFHTTAFRNLLYSFKDPPDSVMSLQNLFTDLQLSSRAPSPDNFIRALGSVNELSMVQHDAHEFLVALLERLETDLGEKFVQGESQLFRGTTTRTIECPSVDYVSTTEESFTTMPIIVDGLKSLRESLSLITAPELLSDDYDTGEKGRAQATQKLTFSQPPPILSFQLCRFKYSTKKNCIIEIKSSFDCPFDLDMSTFSSTDTKTEKNYKLYGIIAHSGNPMYGHYTSFIKTGSNNWVQFNDGSTKIVDESFVSRLFGTSTKSQPSFFGAFTFSSAVAYMCFYVRKDCISYIQPSDFIPLHLAPHRADLYFSKFIFYKDIVGNPLQKVSSSYEWKDENVNISEIVKNLKPNVDFKQYFAWALMPGMKDLIGPLSLDICASIFVIKGLTTTFYIVPVEYNSGPLFIIPKRGPNKCIKLTTCEQLKNDLQDNNSVYRYKSKQIKSLDYFLNPGSIITLETQTKVFLSINDRKYIFNQNSVYSDIQKRVSLFTGINPSSILFLNGTNPLTPQNYRFASQFPISPITYQVLKNGPTAYSISLFTPLNMICISNKFTNELLSPYWARKGTTAQELLNVSGKLFPGCKYGDKLHLVLSIGTFECNRRILHKRECPKNENLRVDVVRHKAINSIKKYKLFLKRSLPFSVEVRFSSDKTLETFNGVSRFITVSKNTTSRDIMKKVESLDMLNLQGDAPPEIIIFFNEKPNIRETIGIDTEIFPNIKKLISKAKSDSSRIVIAIVSNDPFLNNRTNYLTRSLSGLLNPNNKSSQ
ncbi:Clan CA, family C19, ubiquitin hydrolase-like cysteine peptidase [Trichomonas vaginalis G3]|uniref:Ubiquitin carboxyl-terminal hydrolase n=2 Tax=Trichomonas vaginalis (strain ATCC PRA-98 / G3) TaxID=412133 RepID=A2DW64_TRIV3|nr:Clan CA, family C19, ubiquitin hydrolase-like cysteine peptidase [Trichomonas vaginalis G3]|eukprot:XP_001327588.1 Clan CA, family C19, ubiquitin hydrolase-like cysteine peptidase [Trichomonas vaginalis G3]